MENLQLEANDAFFKNQHKLDGLSTRPAFIAGYKIALEQYQWQPIETAPKEGEFFVFMPTNRTPIQHCSAHKNMTIIGNCFAFDFPKPTHWMPLPMPPTEVKE